MLDAAICGACLLMVSLRYIFSDEYIGLDEWIWPFVTSAGFVIELAQLGTLS